jgi:hypothetical protein
MERMAQRVDAQVLTNEWPGRTTIGFVLLGMMIVVEEEFGALPLGLLTGGLVWSVTCRMRDKPDERR